MGSRPKTSTYDPEAEALRAAQNATIASNQEIAARRVRVNRDSLPSALMLSQQNNKQSALTKLGSTGVTGTGS